VTVKVTLKVKVPSVSVETSKPLTCCAVDVTLPLLVTEPVPTLLVMVTL